MSDRKDHGTFVLFCSNGVRFDLGVVGDSVQVGDELATMQVHTGQETRIVQAKAALDGLDITGVEYNRLELQKVLADARFWAGGLNRDDEAENRLKKLSGLTVSRAVYVPRIARGVHSVVVQRANRVSGEIERRWQIFWPMG